VRPAVEIAEVATEPAGGLGLELDAPRPGQVVPGYLFPVRGSVVAGPGSPAIDHFSVAGAGHVSRGVAQIGDGASRAFSFLVGCAARPPEFDLALDAVLEDGTHTRLAAIKGRRSPLESSFEPAVQPLLVTTLGRSGSSVFVQALEGHPEIAAYHPFAADPRPAAYWSSVFRELSDPDSSLRQLAHRSPDRAERGWWLGGGEPQESFADDPLERWMGVDHVISLAGYCQGRIESLYAKIGEGAGIVPGYFAEKARPEAITDTLRELYPRSREVVLVRDWRDVFCSMRSYSAKRGMQLFGRERHGGDEQHLRTLRAAIEELMRHRDANRDRTHTVRYEDLVLDPQPTIARVLEYLDLEGGPEILAAMCAPVRDSGPEGEAHRTTVSGARSIGRWRDELSAELRSGCREELGPLLAQVGYEPE
jgi:hypothetical protein